MGSLTNSGPNTRACSSTAMWKLLLPLLSGCFALSLSKPEMGSLPETTNLPSVTKNTKTQTSKIQVLPSSGASYMPYGSQGMIPSSYTPYGSQPSASYGSYMSQPSYSPYNSYNSMRGSGNTGYTSWVPYNSRPNSGSSLTKPWSGSPSSMTKPWTGSSYMPVSSYPSSSYPVSASGCSGSSSSSPCSSGSYTRPTSMCGSSSPIMNQISPCAAAAASGSGSYGVDTRPYYPPTYGQSYGSPSSYSYQGASLMGSSSGASSSYSYSAPAPVSAPVASNTASSSSSSSSDCNSCGI